MYPEQFRRSPSGNPKCSSRRTDTTPANRNPVYFDSETLQKMIATFGPVEFSQFAVQHPLNEFEFSATGSQEVFDPSVNWHSADWCTSQIYSDMRSKKKNCTPREQAPSGPDSRYMLNQLIADNEKIVVNSSSAQKEAIFQWLDHSIAQHLKQRREESTAKTTCVDPALIPLKAKHNCNLLKGTSNKLQEIRKIEFAGRQSPAKNV